MYLLAVSQVGQQNVKTNLTSDDVQLWDGYRTGSRTAFEQIYAQHYPALYEYGRRKGYDPELIRDVVQDLFVKLWINRATTGPTTHVRYFLLASFKNLLLNTMTKKSNLNYVDWPESDGFLMDFSAETAYIRQEQQTEQTRHLLAALDQLSPRQKEIIYLRYFEEMAFEQIAELMSITLKGAYKLNSRAFEALREILNVPGSTLLLLLLQLRLLPVH